MADIIEFTRGDAAHHTFAIPADAWSEGGTLFFAAKPAIDDDNTDNGAVIQYNWDDSSVTDVVIDGVAYKQYSCDFPPSATNGVLSRGQGKAAYLGEFQYVSSDGVPQTFPPKDRKLRCIVYFDVKRKTTV